MESFLTITGLALTTAFSFSLALLLAWVSLAGLLRLMPATSPGLQLVKPVAVAAQRARRPRVVLTQAKSRSRAVYTVRVA